MKLSYLKEIISLAKEYNVYCILKEQLKDKIKNNKPIHLSELIYDTYYVTIIEKEYYDTFGMNLFHNVSEVIRETHNLYYFKTHKKYI